MKRGIMAALILIIGLVGPAMAGNPSLGMPIMVSYHDSTVREKHAGKNVR